MRNILLVAFLLCPVCWCQRRAEIATDTVMAGTAIADLVLSQQCIQADLCREANPTMPSSAAGMTLTMAAETGASAWSFHHMLKRHRKLAWLIPAGVIAAHVYGIWSNADWSRHTRLSFKLGPGPPLR